MKFEEVYEKYMANLVVSKHQAMFIWNAAIDEALEQYSGHYEDVAELKVDNTTIPDCFFTKSE